MKVLIRILVKLLIFLLVIFGVGGGTYGLRAYRQSTADYTVKRYLSCLLEEDAEQAYALLDQSESTAMTLQQYDEVLDSQDYMLYSSCNVKKGETRRDADGNEYVDYHVEFLDAADEIKLEEDFTAKKQETLILGVFDSWKIMSDHCLIKDYEITVPKGADVYLNQTEADERWLVKNNEDHSYDRYVIPTLIPGDITITIRHAVLEEVRTAVDTSDRTNGYSGKMELKKSAQSECKELGVKALKALFAAAVSDNLDDSEDLFAACMDTAKQYAAEQASVFEQMDAAFKHVSASDFAAQFAEPVFLTEEDGVLTTEMTFSYHYVVRADQTYESGVYLEDGSPEYVTETVAHADDVTASLTMAYDKDKWYILDMDLPLVTGQTEVQDPEE